MVKQGGIEPGKALLASGVISSWEQHCSIGQQDRRGVPTYVGKLLVSLNVPCEAPYSSAVVDAAAISTFPLPSSVSVPPRATEVGASR
jgi:hypothetical protein